MAERKPSYYRGSEKEFQDDRRLAREIVDKLVPRKRLTVAHPSGRHAQTATQDHRQPDRRTKE